MEYNAMLIFPYFGLNRRIFMEVGKSAQASGPGAALRIFPGNLSGS
jgi:hypothetical protein